MRLDFNAILMTTVIALHSYTTTTDARILQHIRTTVVSILGTGILEAIRTKEEVTDSMVSG